MLIDFTVGNYRSFAESQNLSLIASKDTSHPGFIVNRDPYNLLKSAAIYGPNASGKSNLVRALMFMDRFIESSATKMNLGDLIIGVDPFRLDVTNRLKPSSFEIHLLINETEYYYGFSTTRERVYDEWLKVKKIGGKITKPLLRKFSPETKKTEWTLNGELKEQAIGVTDKTRDNGLFLSRAAEMNVAYVKELFLWFRRHVWYFDLSNPLLSLLQKTARLVNRDDRFRKRIEKLLKDADLSIDHISVKSELVSIPDDVPKEIRDFLVHIQKNVSSSVSSSSGENVTHDLQQITVKTYHRISDSNELVEFSLDQDESNGTQRFFSLIGPILDALDDGDLLVVDELDCSIHPLLTQKLVQLFQSPDSNPKGAQLVFTTQDSNLMNPGLFRRDQIWLTEKNSKGSTELFSLSDIESPPRKEEAFEKNYLSGRYGGVPNFGPSFEDFDI